MDWQLLLVIVIVVLAVSYLGRQTLRTWRGKRAGCGGCKCPGMAKTPNDAATETLITLHKGRLRQR